MTHPTDPSADLPPAPDAGISRRALLAGAAATAAAATVGARPYRLLAQADTAGPAIPADPTAVPGVPTTALGIRSPFVHPARAPAGVLSGPSFAPLQDMSGTITPSDLFFERIHNGVAMVDPQKWKLMIHGMVEPAADDRPRAAAPVSHRHAHLLHRVFRQRPHGAIARPRRT